MKTLESFKAKGFVIGRMLSFSKTQYRNANPNSVVYFNANIVTVNDGKIWYGDIDLTIDGNKLKELASELNQTIFVLKEMDCRFETANESINETIKKAVWDTTQEIPMK